MEEENKNYWQRLGDHPGVSVGIMFPILALLCGFDNKSAQQQNVSWQYALICFGVTALICWTCILISNKK